MDVSEWLKTEWAAITGAPFLFIVAAALVGVAVWFFARMFYERQIETLQGDIDSLQRKIAATPEPGEQPKVESQPAKPAKRTVSKHWRKVGTFPLWQAAWLWVGHEPHGIPMPGSAAYPILLALKEACNDGRLKYKSDTPASGSRAKTTPATSRSVVHWTDLKVFAESIHENPEFLRD